MILASFGCSFVWGTELPDCSADQASALSWPSLVARDLGYEYRCHAQGGRGNVFIAEQIMLHAYQADLLLVNWTFLDRYDIRQHNHWQTCLPGHEQDRDYFERYQNDYRDKLTALLLIKNCVDYVIARGKSLVMSAQDPLLFDRNFHSSALTCLLQHQIKPYFLDFEGQSHSEWAHSRGHPLTPQGHLLESGHRAVADHVLSQINTNITKEPTCNSQKTSA
jgi:hypothetical protein